MVTICVITHDNYWLSRYSIENLIQKTQGVETTLIIVDNGSSDQKIIDFGKRVADFHVCQETITSNAYCYNEMIKKIESEWICVFPVGMMVNDYWLSDLLTAAESIDNSGVVGIHAYGKKGVFNPLLTNQDNMRHIWSTLEGDMSGILLFNQSIIQGIGGFDKNLKNEDFAQKQFCFRVKNAGRHTFFIHEQSATDLMGRAAKPNPEDISSYETNIELLKTSKDFRIDI